MKVSGAPGDDVREEGLSCLWVDLRVGIRTRHRFPVDKPLTYLEPVHSTHKLDTTVVTPCLDPTLLFSYSTEEEYKNETRTFTTPLRTGRTLRSGTINYR